VKASESAGRAPFPAEPRWLLIGNSRWHWGGGEPAALQLWHTPPLPAAGGASLAALQGWAAVGPVPAAAGLDPGRRLGLEQVPLQDLPPWLGVDRALVAWRAWRLCAAPVLVADAGTALSLTLVDGSGRFLGGRLQAGLALQLRALAAGTAQLPDLLPLASPGPRTEPEPCDAAESVVIDPAIDAAALAAGGVISGCDMADPWPRATAEAMQLGIREGLVAAVAAAHGQAEQRCPGCRLWVTGGDSDWLAPALGQPASPALALEALALLSSGQDR
jgi:type III pantothenate kinase